MNSITRKHIGGVFAILCVAVSTPVKSVEDTEATRIKMRITALPPASYIDVRRTIDIDAISFDPAIDITELVISDTPDFGVLDTVAAAERKFIELQVLSWRAIYRLDLEEMGKYRDKAGRQKLVNITAAKKEKAEYERDLILIGARLYITSLFRADGMVFVRTRIHPADPSLQQIPIFTRALSTYHREEGDWLSSTSKNEDLRTLIDNNFPFETERIEYPVPLFYKSQYSPYRPRRWWPSYGN